MFQKLIVGVDFTDKSNRAIETGLRLAKSIPGSALVLVHAVPNMAEVRAAMENEGDVTKSLEVRLGELTAQLSAAHGVKVDYGVVVGPSVARELVKYVRTWGGDVLIVGTEARTGIDRLLIGSVAEELVQGSPIPVLVVGPARPG